MYPPNTTNNAYNEIVENLYLGSKQALQYSGMFSMIVNCTNDIPFPDGCRNGIRIAVNDDPHQCKKMIQYIADTGVLEKMNESIRKGEPVLVHCFAGMQRSCAIVACYLMKYYHFTPNQCIGFIRERRPVAFFGGANFFRAMEYYYYTLTS